MNDIAQITGDLFKVIETLTFVDNSTRGNESEIKKEELFRALDTVDLAKKELQNIFKTLNNLEMENRPGRN